MAIGPQRDFYTAFEVMQDEEVVEIARSGLLRHRSILSTSTKVLLELKRDRIF